MTNRKPRPTIPAEPVPPDPVPEVILVVMGVSGCGKSTIAAEIAKRLHWPLVEGDDLHPPANIAKMKQHIPLDDADRQPWLQRIGEQIDTWRAAGSAGLITCSALKHRYRDDLIEDRPNLWFVYLKGSKELIRARLAKRKGHFMPPALLDSQFADLEEPVAGERVLIADITPSPKVIAGNIMTALVRQVKDAAAG
jgi:carbohydrate kinase (thermoresistant glucokinase family)